jgi:hypothetical protein
MELRRETTKWEEMQQNFVTTFAFEHESPNTDTTLKVVRDEIFEEPEVEIATNDHNQETDSQRVATLL